MSKITFKTSAKTEFRDALVMIKDGAHLFTKVLFRVLNASVYKCPYAYIIGIILTGGTVSAMTIMQARAERDAATKRAYTFEQRLDSITMINEAKEEASYVYHAN